MDIEEYLRQGTGFPKCYSCKQPMYIKIDNCSDFVYYDKHYYHKTCFCKPIEFKRKCNFCKKDIILNPNDKNAILYNEKFYHEHCFDEWCVATKKPSKIRLTALENKDRYKQDVKKTVEDFYKKKVTCQLDRLEIETRRMVINSFAERNVNLFLKDFFNIKTISQPVWKKLSQLYNGTYSKFEGKIPPDHLLDMLEQKRDYLQKTNDKLQSSKEWSVDSLIHYDLAILMNKYNDYLAWREKQKVLAVELNDSVQSEVLTETIAKAENRNLKKEQTENNNMSDEIINLVDDIFGE